MGVWGSGLMENDHVLDWVADWASKKRFWEKKAFDQYERTADSPALIWKKSQFDRNFSKLLKSCRDKSKDGGWQGTNIMAFYISGRVSNKPLASFKKVKGNWYHEQVLLLYVWGRRCGYRFDLPFLELVRFACYFRMAYAGGWTNLEGAEEVVKGAKRIQSSLSTPYPVRNLYSVFTKMPWGKK